MITRRVPFTSFVYFLPVGTLAIVFGGGVVIVFCFVWLCFDRVLFCLVMFCFLCFYSAFVLFSIVVFYLVSCLVQLT